MYSEEQYYKALEVYEETKSVTKTITILGCPARRQTLYNWINRKRILPKEYPVRPMISRGDLNTCAKI